MCGFARHLIGLMICLVVIGPVLIIVGIVMLTSKNTRAEDVAAYNDAISAYQAYTTFPASWTGTVTQSGSFANAQTSATSSPVDVSGNKDGVNSATSFYVQASLINYLQTTGINFNMNTGGGGTSGNLSFSRAYPMTTQRNSDIRCSSSTCSDYCYDSDDRECNDDSRLRSECQSLYNSGATFTRTKSYCDSSDVCGFCRYDAYASTLCAVVDSGVEGQVLTADDEKLSCNYPFDLTSNTYTATAPTLSFGSYITPVTVQVRMSNDPYIILQQITEGSNDFGLTEGQQRGIGFACLFIGIAITCALCAVLFYAMNNRENQNDNHQSGWQSQQQQQQQQPHQAYPQAQPVQQAYPVAQPVQQVQPAPGYGQQGTGYGQPQQQQGYPPANNQNQGGWANTSKPNSNEV